MLTTSHIMRSCVCVCVCVKYLMLIKFNISHIAKVKIYCFMMKFNDVQN